MTFHVYPDPQVAPLAVAPGATAFAAIGQLTGASVPAGAYRTMMFIRVAMTGGATAPTLLVKAGTGTAVAVTTLATAVFRTPGTDGYVGDVQLLTAGEPANVYQIRIGFDQNTAEAWQIGIQNNDAVSRDFTWVVADSAADTAQPWIDVTPAALSCQALAGETVSQSVQVSNKGTGTLIITSVNPALPTGFTVATPLPLAVAPSQARSLALMFAGPAPPPPGGLTTGSADLVATPPDTTAGTGTGHNQRISITATTQLLEVVLLLDDSGSMSWDPLGNPQPAGAPTSRWSELASAASQFLDLLAHFGQDRGRFGIARFPPGDPFRPPTFDIVPMTSIPGVAGMGKPGGPESLVTAIQPWGSTPLGDGLDRVLAAATSYFGTDSGSVSTGRRWLILMSDGAHNAGTHNPLEFIAPPVGTAPVGAALAEKNVDLFAVAYGIDGHTNVNHVLLKQLASGSLNGGQIRSVDQDGTTASALAAALRDAIKSGLTPASAPLDPNGVFVAGQGEARHEVLLTRHDTRAAFVLSWNTPDPDRLRLEILTPGHELITPENAGRGSFTHVTFRGGDRSQMYLIDPDFLREPGPAEAAARPRPRHGAWTLVITGPGGVMPGEDPPGYDRSRPELENYGYDVIVDSALRLEVGQDRATYFAGDPVTVSARLTADGRPVTGAAVSLSATAPAQAAANWLASLDVPADALRRAGELLADQDSTPLLVKQLGARLAGLVFDGGQRQVTLPMTDPDGTGTYRATLAATQVPGHYGFYVTAAGATGDAAGFRREGKQETFVLVRPDRDHTHVDIEQIEPDMVRVTVFPRDRFGNVLLVEPGTAGGFGLVAPGATVGGLVSGLDGTYTSTVSFDPGETTAIGVQFGGREVIALKRIFPAPALLYPDQVISFRPGAIQAANQHADPQAALGSVAGQPAGTFTSLGAGGELVVGFDRHVILASDDGDDEITVFVQPDADLRAYRVEAHSMALGRWMPLGESTGVTQSFGLHHARLRYTVALRITDMSGRTRDAALRPLTTPGVSVRGIGVLKISETLPFDLNDLPGWLSSLWREDALAAALAAPVLASPPREFSPRTGTAGQQVTLSGRNLDIGTIAVMFGTFPATIVGTPTPSQVVVVVPDFGAGQTTTIRISNEYGSVQSNLGFTQIAD